MFTDASDLITPQSLIVPISIAAVYGVIAAAMDVGDLVPVSIVVFGSLFFALNSGKVFDPQETDGGIERVATAILGHWALRAAVLLGVVAIFLALFDAVAG